MGEQLLVALDAERFLVAEDVPVTGQVERAVEACQDRALRGHRLQRAPVCRPDTRRKGDRQDSGDHSIKYKQLYACWIKSFWILYQSTRKLETMN